MSSASIVVFGSINLDLTAYVPSLPRPGETLRGHRFITVPGGKGANQAVAAARLGARTAFVGRVGDDGFGREVLPLIRQEGVDTSRVEVDSEHGTGLAVISVDDRAENAIIVISGANWAVGPRDAARCAALVEAGASVLLLQMEVPLEASLEAAQAARRRGVCVIFDPAPASPLPDDAYPLFDVITPNETEAEILLGYRPETVEEAARAAADLRARGAKAAIIKLGGRGATYAFEGGEGHIPPFPATPVDTVAAGDAFNGGLAVALAEGHTLPEAARWGAAAGAIAVTRPGAMPSMPHRAELDTLLHQGTLA